jgi:hypothetical protein
VQSLVPLRSSVRSAVILKPQENTPGGLLREETGRLVFVSIGSDVIRRGARNPWQSPTYLLQPHAAGAQAAGAQVAGAAQVVQQLVQQGFRQASFALRFSRMHGRQQVSQPQAGAQALGASQQAGAAQVEQVVQQGFRQASFALRFSRMHGRQHGVQQLFSQPQAGAQALGASQQAGAGVQQAGAQALGASQHAGAAQQLFSQQQGFRQASFALRFSRMHGRQHGVQQLFSQPQAGAQALGASQQAGAAQVVQQLVQHGFRQASLALRFSRMHGRQHVSQPQVAFSQQAGAAAGAQHAGCSQQPQAAWALVLAANTTNAVTASTDRTR